MPGIQPIISYPGVIAPESVIATDSHGITPNTFLLNIIPQISPIAEEGDFVIGAGNAIRTWKDCTIDASSITYDANGLITSLTILDRRWRWSYGSISGHYNVRNESGDIIKKGDDPDNPQLDTQRTPQELATLILESMNEVDFDVSDIPNDYSHEVEWEFANPAQELAKLCELLGCRIVLQMDDTVAIRRIGQGSELPIGPIDQASSSIDPPESPRKVHVVSSPIEYQWDFELEPVALDVDGGIKSLRAVQNSDVSWVPEQDLELSDAGDIYQVEGFSKLGFPSFPELEKKARTAAQQSLFRWYVIKVPFTFPDKEIGEEGVIRHREQITLLDRQVNTSRIVTRRLKPIDPFCYGIWHNEDRYENTATDEDTEAGRVFPPAQNDKNPSVVPANFFIDKKLWLVKFSRPVYLLKAPVNAPVAELYYYPAVLRLRIAFHYRNPDRSYFRRVDEFVLDEPTTAREETQTLIVNRPELLPAQFVDFATQPGDDFPALLPGQAANDAKLESNFKDITDNAMQIVDVVKNTLTNRQPAANRYIGIVPTDLDGAIQSITYQWTESGPLTTIQRNQDNGSDVALPYQLRRRWEKQREIDALVDNNKGSNPKRRLELTIT